MKDENKNNAKLKGRFLETFSFRQESIGTLCLLQSRWMVCMICVKNSPWFCWRKDIERILLQRPIFLNFLGGQSGLADVSTKTMAQFGYADLTEQAENATDFIKAVADAVTESNENDGAAIAVERYALHRPVSIGI